MIQTSAPEPVKQRVTLLPSQMRFMRSRAESLLFSGAAGAGKTRVLCLKAYQHALTPGNRVGLFRKRRTDLRATTLKTLLQPDGDLPPVIPEGTYTHNKNECEIQLRGGGEIVYVGCDDETKMGSLNLGAGGVDEGIELDEEEWDMLETRLRNKGKMYYQLFCATNPGTPSHFLYQRFFGPDRQPCNEVIETRTLDNIFLDDEYIERLERLTGTAYQRLVLGRWVAHQGLIFGDLVVEAADGPWKEMVCGVDAGYHNPHAVLLGFPAYGAPHVISELTGSEWTEAEYARRIAEWLPEECEMAWCDPSAPSLIKELMKLDITAKGAPNEVLPGINSVMEATPTISPQCPELKRECLSYRWDSKKEDTPVKQDDHGPDALRYAIRGHSQKSGFRVESW